MAMSAARTASTSSDRPAANEVSGIFRTRFVLVGCYALRGVAQPQELFTPESNFELPR
jgi:hypothetical protein